MIPKIGDKVRVNPEFSYCRGNKKLCGSSIDTLPQDVFTVRKVFIYDDDYFLVELDETSFYAWINSAGQHIECTRCDVKCMISGKSFFVVTHDITSDLLRKENTRLESKTCIKCSGPLKDPGMGPAYKHCPRCEP